MKIENQTYLRNLIKETTGLIISDTQTYLFETRLPPLLRKFDLKCLDSLVEAIKRKTHANLEREVTEALMTYESLFFRDSKPFEQLATDVIPALIASGKKTIRIWCAACSSGQEPYSVAMMLKEKGFDQKVRIDLIASDVSEGILDKAKRGIYSQFEVQRGLPITHLIKYFKQIDLGWEVKDEVKNMITFKQINLLEPFRSMGNFDIILCRNVLIYFDKQTKQGIIQKFSELLQPSGILLLGSAESLLGIDHAFEFNPEKRFMFTLKNSAA